VIAPVVVFIDPGVSRTMVQVSTISDSWRARASANSAAMVMA